ncbi:DUF421 domain-containing protein, partial [Psychroserpens sp.]|uniref:DUF421 domain-containing protein n=1 Tax=Psychroserpens sp. TaxID=2020870 RepID=UPI003C707A27
MTHFPIAVNYKIFWVKKFLDINHLSAIKVYLMKEWFTSSSENLVAIILTAIGIYVALVVLTRLSGKRSFSKMSSFDFAMTVAIGSVMATVIVCKSVSLPQGIVGLAIIYALQISVAYLRRIKAVQQLMDNKPTLLMKDGTIIEGSLDKCHVTESDLKAKLREANV